MKKGIEEYSRRKAGTDMRNQQAGPPKRRLETLRCMSAPENWIVCHIGTLSERGLQIAQSPTSRQFQSLCPVRGSTISPAYGHPATTAVALAPPPNDHHPPQANHLSVTSTIVVYITRTLIPPGKHFPVSYKSDNRRTAWPICLYHGINSRLSPRPTSPSQFHQMLCFPS